MKLVKSNKPSRCCCGQLGWIPLVVIQKNKGKCFCIVKTSTFVIRGNKTEIISISEPSCRRTLTREGRAERKKTPWMFTSINSFKNGKSKTSPLGKINDGFVPTEHTLIPICFKRKSLKCPTTLAKENQLQRDQEKQKVFSRKSKQCLPSWRVRQRFSSGFPAIASNRDVFV